MLDVSTKALHLVYYHVHLGNLPIYNADKQ